MLTMASAITIAPRDKHTLYLKCDFFHDIMLKTNETEIVTVVENEYMQYGEKIRLACGRRGLVVDVINDNDMPVEVTHTIVIGTLSIVLACTGVFLLAIAGCSILIYIGDRRIRSN